MMLRLSRLRALPFAIAAALLLLLAVLAHLQWRWSGEIGTLERQRLRSSLQLTGTRIAEGLDREIMGLVAALHTPLDTAPDPAHAMVGRLAQWRSEATDPDLVAGAYMIRVVPGREAVLERVSLDEQRLVPTSWPAPLAGLRNQLLAHGMQYPPITFVAAGTPFLFVPSPSGSAILVELDARLLATVIVPRVVEEAQRWRAGAEISVSVMDRSRGGVVYRSDPQAPASPREAELCFPILGVRPLAQLRHGWDARHGPGADHVHPVDIAPSCTAPSETWQVLVRLRGRTVETAVAGLRRHNLVVSLGILGLLAITTVVLVVTTQRARRLARQQIEFVAGVTHELHTPLTAIRSAGANLADGVVADPAQVRRYGGMIEGEGRRLSTLVAKLLEHAGIHSGRRVYRHDTVAISEVVDGALEDSRLLLEQAGIVVERELAAELPVVRGDAAALRGAIQNLVENAVKHGGTGHWLQVAVRGTNTGIEIAISDRGPGIPRDELGHLFEPFVRGRSGKGFGVGLGLALVKHVVEAHGGRVDVISATGTTFTITLPAGEPA